MSFYNSSEDKLNLHWVRSAVDLMASFVLAVIVLRGFLLEGYLISTGSMAPGLLGFHRRIVCPVCQQTFAFGVSFDDSVDPSQMASVSDDGEDRQATCPNCGQVNIEVADVPASHGDQLLVQKHIYDFRRPHRWETIVFRNPASPGEAYVKRVVGLPGESLQVIDGDVYIDGRIARKDFRTQREMRIAVSDLHHLADSPLWEMPWQPDAAWTLRDGKLQLSGEDVAGNIQFRPWRWYGGNHFAETPLAPEDAGDDWNKFLERFDRLPLSWASRIEYDTDRSVLRCEGVMPEEMQADLMARSTHEGFRSAVYRLAALSHLAPVTDHYGYNSMVLSPEYPVQDLMLRTVLSWQHPPEEIQVDVPVESDIFAVRVFPESGKVQLVSQDRNLTLQEGICDLADPSPAEIDSDTTSGLEIEVSNFDRQLIVAINGTPVFAPFVVEHQAPSSPESKIQKSQDAAMLPFAPKSKAPGSGIVHGSGMVKDKNAGAAKAAAAAILWERQAHWGLKVRGRGVEVQQLQMFRDVYYTPGRRKNGIDSPYLVHPDSYFVQGDNSPVSSDSRNWSNPCVPHKMLLGKPFLLHLPSRPAVIEVGAWRRPVRIPDWSRIRYIH